MRFMSSLSLPKRAVFVLHLHRDDRAAARDLQRSQLPAQALQPALRRTQKFFIGAAQHDLRIGQKPRRQAAQIPLGAGIRAGPQDHIKSLFLRDANKSGDIDIVR